MIKTYNATRHSQRELAGTWAKHGVEFIPTAGAGINSVPPQATANFMLGEAIDAVDKAKAAGAEAILVGGITGLSILIAMLAHSRGLRVLEPMIARKANGVPDIHGVRDFTETIRGIQAGVLAAWVERMPNGEAV